LAEIQAADEARRKAGIDPQKKPAQIPKADADAKVMPNKEGGYAPNYTPLAATDGVQGFLVDCDVVADPREDGQTLATVDRIEENFGQKPERFLADTAHATGENLAGMEQRQVEFYSPVESSLPAEGNPAKRDDHRCKSCGGCALAEVCRDPKAKRGRSISRDQYEPLRERMHQRMKSPQGKATYARRMHTAETPFAHIKWAMGVRQFLLRGLENVRIEWLWACTAYNLKKLLAVIGKLRATLACVAAETAG
jgi:hypothetical protein